MQIKHTPTSFASGYALGLEQTQRTGSHTELSVWRLYYPFVGCRSTHIGKLSSPIGRGRNKLEGQVVISFFHLQWAMSLLQFTPVFISFALL